MTDKFMSLTQNIDRRRVLKGGMVAGATALMPGFIGRAKAKTPGLIVFGLSSYPPGFKPWENKGTASTTVKVQQFRGLLGYGPDGQPRSELAESWKILAGNKFQFTLRDNAYFHNGDKVTSADVKATYEAMAAKDSTARLRSRFGAVANIETPDARTVIITLNAADVTFIDIAASPHAGIVSGKALAASKWKPLISTTRLAIRRPRSFASMPSKMRTCGSRRLKPVTQTSLNTCLGNPWIQLARTAV